MKAIVEAGGGTTDDIIKMTVAQGPFAAWPVNAEWIKMFPDGIRGPRALSADGDGRWRLVQCDFTAVID